MSTLAQAKARYDSAKDGARRQAALRLEQHVGVQFHISGWSHKAREAIRNQWDSKSKFDWPEIFRKHRDPDRLDMVIWANERLAGLSLALTCAEYVEVRFAEGDPRLNCPLKGRRALIFLECAACYAQALGRTELHIQPINEQLKALYEQTYGFELVIPKKGCAYYKKPV